MDRKDAILMISKLRLKDLDKYERSERLLGWWSIDKENTEYKFLPKELQDEMKANKNYGNPISKKYDPLILQALIHEYRGVRNEFIEKQLNQHLESEIEIVGEIERFEKCPCCGYKTLDERGSFDICDVCFWEDDGIEELDKESGPNRMTLREGKENFEKIGACEKELYQYVTKEPDLKYEK